MSDATIITIVGSVLGVVQGIATLYLKARIDKVSCGNQECRRIIREVLDEDQV